MQQNNEGERVIIYARLKTPPRDFYDDRWDWQIDSCKDYAKKQNFAVVDVVEDYGLHLDHLGDAFKRIGLGAKQYKATKLLVTDYSRLVPMDYFRLCCVIWALKHYHGLEIVPMFGKIISRETDVCYANLAAMFNEFYRVID